MKKLIAKIIVGIFFWIVLPLMLGALAVGGNVQEYPLLEVYFMGFALTAIVGSVGWAIAELLE